MNYLSHFVVDCRLGNPYYNTGLILPDFTKSWVTTFKVNPSEKLTPEQTDLLKGCLRHYHSDRMFHASGFFAHYQEIVNQKLKSLPFSPNLNRKWFIGHVLTELLIDRNIVRYFNHLTDDFYEQLNRAQNDQIAGFLRAFGASETQDFLTGFDRFREVRYIYYYTDNNKFLYSLNRIMMRVGLPEMVESDRQLILEGILDLEQHTLPQGKVWLDELKNVFA